MEPVLDHGHIVVAHFSQRPGWWYQRNCQLRSRTKPVWLNSYTYSELSKLAHLLDGGQQHVLDLYRSTLGLPCLVEPYVYILDSSPPDNTPSSLFQIDPCDPNKIDHALAYAGTFGLFRRTDMHLFSGLLLEIVSHLVKRPLSEREYPFGFFTNSLTGVVHSGISGDSTRYIYGLSDAHFDPLDSLPPHLLSGYKTEPGTRSRFSHLLVEFLGPTKVSLYHQAIAEYYTSLICLSIESLYKNPLPSLEQDSVITQVAGYLNEFAYHRGTSFRLENPLQTPPGISDFVLPSLLESLQLVPSQLRDQVRQTLIVNSQTWPDPEMFGPAGLFPNEFFRRLFPTLT